MSDLIKRSDAIEVAYQLRGKPNDEEWDWWLRSFNAIPSADRPQGEWVATDDTDEWYGGVYKCNICGSEVIGGCDNYCPNCGARMKGADDE